MVAGFGLALYYTLANQPEVRETLGITSPQHLWWNIQPIAAGLFGVPAGFVVAIVVSLLTSPPSRAAMDMVDEIRSPD
jgi:cation/acetate symporter